MEEIDRLALIIDSIVFTLLCDPDIKIETLDKVKVIIENDSTKV